MKAASHLGAEGGVGVGCAPSEPLDLPLTSIKKKTNNSMPCSISFIRDLKILRRVRGFLNTQVVYAREPASFCREYVVAVVTLLPVFERMSWLRKQGIEC